MLDILSHLSYLPFWQTVCFSYLKVHRMKLSKSNLSIIFYNGGLLHCSKVIKFLLSRYLVSRDTKFFFDIKIKKFLTFFLACYLFFSFQEKGIFGPGPPDFIRLCMLFKSLSDSSSERIASLILTKPILILTKPSFLSGTFSMEYTTRRCF